MNLKRLKEAEAAFLKTYPGGFEHPLMADLVKKHKPAKMTQLASECFAKQNFKDSGDIVNSMVRVVSQSSMISVFEKPRFRDVMKSLSGAERDVVARGLKGMLYGSQKRGFEAILGVLSSRKMAKWTLMTIVPAYLRPEQEVFVKPTTTKSIISNLELDLTYKPTPTWAFYEAYRGIINEIKHTVSRTLWPSNPAFCGFLMMSFDARAKR